MLSKIAALKKHQNFTEKYQGKRLANFQQISLINKNGSKMLQILTITVREIYMLTFADICTDAFCNKRRVL